MVQGKWVLAAGVIILAAIGAGALSMLRMKPAAKPAVPAPAPAVYAGPEVELTGSIRAQHVVQVPAPVEGTVGSFLANVGDEVYEGQLLAQISNTGLESELETANQDLERTKERLNTLESTRIALRLEASRARADASRARSEFDRAEKNFQRQQMLHREGATPRLTFEKAQSAFESAKTEYESREELARTAEERLASLVQAMDSARRQLEDKTRALEEAKANLASAEVRSPSDGIVVGRRGEIGQPVDLEVQDLFHIAVDLSLLEVVLEPEPPVLARIRAGQQAEIHAAEAPPGGLPGTVKEIQGTQAIVEFVSPTPALKPGLTVHVRIKLT